MTAQQPQWGMPQYYVLTVYTPTDCPGALAPMVHFQQIYWDVDYVRWYRDQWLRVTKGARATVTTHYRGKVVDTQHFSSWVA